MDMNEVCIYVMVVFIGVLVRLLTVGTGVSQTLLPALGDPFPPNGLPYPALI